MIRRIWILALAGALGAQAPQSDPDGDGDGLSDFQEIHKYLTDPAKKDTDGDGIPDGDWNERREYAYTVRTVVTVLRPADLASMNDDFQDARLIEETADRVKAEVVHYPFGTAGEAIPSNPRWAEDAAPMRPWLESTTTSNWDDKMRTALIAGVGDFGSLDDKALVERAAPWLLRHANYEDGFTTFYTSFDGSRPFVTPEVRDEVDKECRKAGRKVEEQWNHELFAKSMFETGTRGSCTSSAIYLAGGLRALGLPARIVLCIPCIDANDPAELEMLRKNVKHHRVRRSILAALEQSKGWNSHTFNEVWIGGRWRRLNYSRLGQPILDEKYLGLMTHVVTLRDWADGKAAATIGKRQAQQARDAVLTTANPYSAASVEDLFGAHCKVPNPPVEEPPVAAAAVAGAPRELTIDSVMWSDDPKLSAGAAGVRLTLLGHVRDWKEWDSYKKFTQDADARFVLEAPGHAEVVMGSGVGGMTMTDGSIWVMLHPEAGTILSGVSYTLRPRNEKPPLRWLVADELKVVRK